MRHLLLSFLRPQVSISYTLLHGNAIMLCTAHLQSDPAGDENGPNNLHNSSSCIPSRLPRRLCSYNPGSLFLHFSGRQLCERHGICQIIHTRDIQQRSNTVVMVFTGIIMIFAITVAGSIYVPLPAMRDLLLAMLSIVAGFPS